MNDLTDQQLLRDYSERQTDAAFAELVRRHVDLVYSATLRMVRDAHLAEDVTQAVFIALAQDALDLNARPVLSGWLHRTAQNLAAKAVRTDVRRRAREQEAATMNELLATEPDLSRRSETAADVWAHIAPQLDAALGELSEPDRDAVLLRYFENKSLREVGLALGTSDDTAQKRVSRAVERLREVFAKRGVTVGASGLVVVISANAVQAAPVGLAVTISTAAALAGTTLATATATAVKTIAMTTLQKTIIGATLAAAVGTGIYEARQASTLRKENQMLQRQIDQLAEMTKSSEVSVKPTVPANNAATLPNDQFRELLRLRGEVGVMRRETNEVSKLRNENLRLRTQLKRRSESSPSQGRNIVNHSARNEQKIFPGYISWAGLDVNEVLVPYGELLNTNSETLEIHVDPEIKRRASRTIAYTNTQEMTPLELAGVIERLLREQAGIVVEHLSPNQIIVKPQAP